MHFVLAPDSYKGSVSALGVANAMQKGILEVFPDAKIKTIPIADGGEGTVEALVAATKGQIMTCEVSDPLGKKINSFFGAFLQDDKKTAVIEMAAASGLPLVPADKRNPLLTSSRGTGELILEALNQGYRKFIIGIGGSATNDAGAGMMSALGAKFLDANNAPIKEGGAALLQLATIDLSTLDARLAECEIVVACDVDNPLCGERGASAVFGPQKGATPEMVKLLDKALAHFAKCAFLATQRDVENVAGAGAAGGLGAALLFFTNAKLRAGVEIVLEAVNFAEQVKAADFVITGEGRTDFQTAFGKAPVGVAKVAKAFNVPVFCISGGLGTRANDVLAQGIDAIMSICDKPMPLEECMKEGEKLIENATARLCHILRAARHKT